MVKQTIQIFARVKPTVRKQQQGVRVGAARAPARRGLSGRGRGGTRGSPARVRGSAPGAGYGQASSTLCSGTRTAHGRQHIAVRGRGQTPPVHFHPTQTCGPRLTCTEPPVYSGTHVFMQLQTRARTCTSACMRDHRLASAVRPYCTFLENSYSGLPTQVHSNFCFILGQNVQARDTCLHTRR